MGFSRSRFRAKPASQASGLRGHSWLGYRYKISLVGLANSFASLISTPVCNSSGRTDIRTFTQVVHLVGSSHARTIQSESQIEMHRCRSATNDQSASRYHEMYLADLHGGQSQSRYPSTLRKRCIPLYVVRTRGVGGAKWSDICVSGSDLVSNPCRWITPRRRSTYSRSASKNRR